MGKNNKSRRAAKSAKRRRQNAAGAYSHTRDHARSNDSLTDGDLVTAAVLAQRAGDLGGRDMLVSRLGERSRHSVAQEVEAGLVGQVSGIWENGWQPADVMNLTVRMLGQRETGLVRCAIAAEAAGYEQGGEAVAAGWMAQLDDVGAERWWDPDRPWLLQVEGPWPEVLVACVRLLSLLGTLPELPRLIPPPAQWLSLTATRSPSGTHLAPGILAKVRALLAKAESTSFDAEAEALTAKAQELMTRHRIDRATAGGEDLVDEEVVGRRIWIDNPYPEAKSVLLAGIAGANGCRAVWTKDFGFVTVFGFAEELDGVEELFTSLLVQATTALQREGSKSDRYGRSRTTRFRRSFLVAFGHRVSERLRHATDETVRTAEAQTGSALVPILVRREQAADEAVERVFQDLKSVSVSATDWEGYRSGTRLGDRADLGTGDPVPQAVAQGTEARR